MLQFPHLTEFPLDLAEHVIFLKNSSSMNSYAVLPLSMFNPD